jgi:hypothetical protein
MDRNLNDDDVVDQFIKTADETHAMLFCLLVTVSILSGVMAVAILRMIFT